ncbi:hypothetical protein [Magnetofaba australis]|uniref:hypothetical protein n=1 Tax=Magnetofaba australis TaxID=1472297 RepID=UPI000A19F510|nr:hypothetical protein [Magnetofaba australis]
MKRTQRSVQGISVMVVALGAASLLALGSAAPAAAQAREAMAPTNLGQQTRTVTRAVNSQAQHAVRQAPSPPPSESATQTAHRPQDALNAATGRPRQ